MPPYILTVWLCFSTISEVLHLCRHRVVDSFHSPQSYVLWLRRQMLLICSCILWLVETDKSITPPIVISGTDFSKQELADTLYGIFADSMRTLIKNPGNYSKVTTIRNFFLLFWFHFWLYFFSSLLSKLWPQLPYFAL